MPSSLAAVECAKGRCWRMRVRATGGSKRRRGASAGNGGASSYADGAAHLISAGGPHCSVAALIDHDGRVEGRPVPDPRHVDLREIDAAVRAVVERQAVIGMWQVRAGAELGTPVGIMQEETLVGVQDRVVDRRRRVPQRRSLWVA